MIEFHVDGSATIEVSGEIDIATSATITDQVTAAVRAAPSAVRILMGDVTFIDSTGLGALVASRKACAAQGIPFAVADPSPRVLRVLQLTGLDLAIDIRTGAADNPGSV